MAQKLYIGTRFVGESDSWVVVVDDNTDKCGTSLDYPQAYFTPTNVDSEDADAMGAFAASLETELNNQSEEYNSSDPSHFGLGVYYLGQQIVQNMLTVEKVDFLLKQKFDEIEESYKNINV